MATNDVHCFDEEDFLARQVLVCIGTDKQLSQEDRLYSEKGRMAIARRSRRARLSSESRNPSSRARRTSIPVAAFLKARGMHFKASF
jgi:DNA polymerase III alpha subunit